MPNEPETLFQSLEPPPGGSAGLRRQLEHEPRRRRTRVVAVAFAGMAALVGLLLIVHRPPAPLDRLQAARFDPALVSLGLQNAPDEPAAIAPGMRHRVALLRVPLETDRVVFYYVAALPDSLSGSAGATGDRDSSTEDQRPEQDDE